MNKEAFVLVNKATMKLIACRTDEHHLRLVDYGRGQSGDATRECVVLEEVCNRTGKSWEILHHQWPAKHQQFSAAVAGFLLSGFVI